MTMLLMLAMPHVDELDGAVSNPPPDYRAWKPHPDASHRRGGMIEGSCALVSVDIHCPCSSCE
jgi:hypothetical protein